MQGFDPRTARLDPGDFERYARPLSLASFGGEAQRRVVQTVLGVRGTAPVAGALAIAIDLCVGAGVRALSMDGALAEYVMPRAQRRDARAHVSAHAPTFSIDAGIGAPFLADPALHVRFDGARMFASGCPRCVPGEQGAPDDDVRAGALVAQLVLRELAKMAPGLCTARFVADAGAFEMRIAECPHHG